MTQNHVIGSVTLQVRATRQADGFALQQDMSRWFWDEFLPVLDSVLTELAPDDELIRLDKLDIVVPALPPDRWRKEITSVLAAALRGRLERLAHYPSPLEAASIERLRVAQSHFEAWVFFFAKRSIAATIPCCARNGAAQRGFGKRGCECLGASDLASFVASQRAVPSATCLST